MPSFLYFQQEVHAPWPVSMERWGHGTLTMPGAWGMWLLPRRWSPSDTHQSQNQPTHALDPLSGATGHHSLNVSQTSYAMGLPSRSMKCHLPPLLGHWCHLPSSWRPPELRLCPHGHRLWRSSLCDGHHASHIHRPPLWTPAHKARDRPPCHASIATFQHRHWGHGWGTKHPDVQAAVALPVCQLGGLTDHSTPGLDPSTFSMCAHQSSHRSGCHFSLLVGLPASSDLTITTPYTVCCWRWVQTKYIL